ncbi:MAG TPA: hypothetical protein VFF27_07610 [Bacteroidia bacterium]|nr:hypothetical protein [Bacteroidia bacterium]
MEQATSSISNFKRFLIRFLFPSVLVIGIVTVAIDFFFTNRIILKTQSAGAYKIYRNIYETHLQEIPVFGSSRASGSYIPDIIDTTIFNYGIEKTQFNLLRIFLTQEFKQNKKKPVIINFDYEEWADWIGDPANCIPNLNSTAIESYFKKYDEWYYHVVGLRYFGLYQHYLKNYIGNNSQKNYLNKGGFFLLEKTTQEDLNEEIKLRMKTPGEYFPNPEKEQQLIDLFARAGQRQCFVVVAPYHHSYMKQLKGKPLADLFFKKIEQLPNVHVFDESDAPYADSLFKNTTHLNYKGAVRFSTELKEKLHAVCPDYFN